VPTLQPGQTKEPKEECRSLPMPAFRKGSQTVEHGGKQRMQVSESYPGEKPFKAHSYEATYPVEAYET
jgi:hypothetical protein